MQAVILAGGRGTRLSEETVTRPKPLVSVGGQPILWHIMKYLAAYGVDEFVICLGYKGYAIKEYFLNLSFHSSDFSVDLATGHKSVAKPNAEPWRVHLVDTGEESNTAGRLRRVGHLLKPTEPFFFTYGDGLTDADLEGEIAFHRDHGGLATVLAVSPPSRYGRLDIRDSAVVGFEEKSAVAQWISGGYFVLQPEVVDLIEGDSTSWEYEVLPRLAQRGELFAYKHEGFWSPMDTLREKEALAELWTSYTAPWKIW